MQISSQAVYLPHLDNSIRDNILALSSNSVNLYDIRRDIRLFMPHRLPARGSYGPGGYSLFSDYDGLGDWDGPPRSALCGIRRNMGMPMRYVLYCLEIDLGHLIQIASFLNISTIADNINKDAWRVQCSKLEGHR